MTEEILGRGAKLKVFEIDRGFVTLIRQFFADREPSGQFSIVEGDVLKKWMNEIPDGSENLKLFGNLPYNIAATFIADTISRGFTFERCVFTVQKEVAERICAGPGSKNYSAFSVLCQWKYDVSRGLELAPGNFWPRPNVSSQAVLMKKKENPLECSDPKLFVNLVHALFSSRRKTIQNNIRSILPKSVNAEDIFGQAGMSGGERAENLSVGDFMLLSQTLSSAIIA